MSRGERGKEGDGRGEPGSLVLTLRVGKTVGPSSSEFGLRVETDRREGVHGVEVDVFL